MILRDLLSCWPFGSKSNQGLDLTAEIDACERQLRTKNKNDLTNERTPLFRGLPSGRSTPERRMTAASSDDFGTTYESDEAPSWLEYSYKPLRLFAQLLYDFLLALAIATVWISDQLTTVIVWISDQLAIATVWILDRPAIVAAWISEYWYRWLYVALPPTFCFTAFKFIMRGSVWLHIQLHTSSDSLYTEKMHLRVSVWDTSSHCWYY